MKIADINKKFTEKVAEYIAKGYIINAPSMAGSQGEVGKVDLVKGTELIRIWLNSESEYNWDNPNAWSDNKLVLRVSRWKHPYDPHKDVIVWHSELVHHEEVIFYELGRFRDSRWYVESLAEALACVKKGNERRYKYRSYTSETVDITSAASREIAAKYLKNHQGYQRVSREKITVCKKIFRDNSTPGYIIYYNYTQIYKLK